MADVLNIEWLNGNSQRTFPFREDTSLGASNTDFTLPNYLIVDFALSMPADIGTRVYLSNMGLVGTFISLKFTDAQDRLITTLAVDLALHTPYTSYNLVGSTDTYDDVRGKIVLGDLTRFRDDVVDGTYQFTLDTAEFEPCVIRPDIRGVRSVTLESNTGLSESITGKVLFQAGENARLRYDANTNAIIFDAISPVDGSYNEPCECNDYLNPPPIKTINHIPLIPDPDDPDGGDTNIDFIGDGKCVEITKSGNKLHIRNICSEPCCGCTELEFIKTNMDLAESNLVKLESYYAQLNERLNQFITNALLSS